jgi:hypothetical protein
MINEIKNEIGITNISYIECEKCSEISYLVEDSHYESIELHCLNDECRYYHIDSRTFKDENSNAVDETGFSTPSEFKEFLEFMKWNQCETCRNVDSPHWDGRNDESPYYCQDCE